MLGDIKIDLEKLKDNKLNESFAAEFAGQIKYLLRHLYAGPLTHGVQPSGIAVTGKKSDLSRFSDVISREKKYMDSYMKHGLGNPKVRNNKMALDKAIYSFEKETGLLWPIK